GRPLASFVHLNGGKGAVIGEDGNYLADADAEAELLFVTQPEQGPAALLSPREFADTYGWKNEPSRVGALTSALDAQPDARCFARFPLPLASGERVVPIHALIRVR